MAEEDVDATTYNIFLNSFKNGSYSRINEGIVSAKQEDPMILASYYMMYKIGKCTLCYLQFQRRNIETAFKLFKRQKVSQ